MNWNHFCHYLYTASFHYSKIRFEKKRDHLRGLGVPKKRFQVYSQSKNKYLAFFFLTLPTSVFKIVTTQIQNPPKNPLFFFQFSKLYRSFLSKLSMWSKFEGKCNGLVSSQFSLQCNFYIDYYIFSWRPHGDLLTTCFMFCF